MYTYIISIFMCLCLDRAAQRFYFDEENLEGKKKVLSTFFVSISVVSILVYLSSSVFYLLLNSEIKEYYKIFYYGVVVSMLNSFSLIALSYYRLTENPKKYVILKLFRFIINTLFIICVLVWVEKTGFAKIISDILAIAIMLPVYVIIIKSKIGFSFDINILKKGFKYSIPLIPTILIAWILSLSNRFFLEYYHGIEMVGLFGMAFKISSATLVVCTAITNAYIPTFYKLAKRNSKSDLFFNNQISYIYIFLSFVLALFVPEIVYFLISSQYAEIEFSISLLILSNLLNSIMGVTTVLYILHSKNTLFNLYCGIGAAFLSVLLNVSLIPLFGLLGAASTSIMSSILLFSLQIYFSKKGFYLNSKIILKISLILLCITVIYSLSKFKLDLYLILIKILITFISLYFVIKLCKKHDYSLGTLA